MFFNRFGNRNKWVYEGQLLHLWKSESSLSFAPGSGLTAAADLSLTYTMIGFTTGPYVTPTNNWWALFTNQFTAAAKSAATGVEWLTSSDTAPYARQAMGAGGTGWTVTAYASSTGVVWKNTNTLTQPAVAGTSQTLFACGWMDSVGPTGGNCNFFIDLVASDGVGIGTNVVLTALTGAIFTTY